MTCALLVSPARGRPTDTIQITYDLTGFTSPSVQGSTRFAEEALGRSLRIRDASGRVHRLQPKPMHLLGVFGAEVIKEDHLQYRLRWPSSMLGLVDSVDWSPGWLDAQDATPARFTWPPGRNTLYADLRIYPISEVGVEALRPQPEPVMEGTLVSCGPTTLDIAPW
jgi:hypothetical protein